MHPAASSLTLGSVMGLLSSQPACGEVFEFVQKVCAMMEAWTVRAHSCPVHIKVLEILSHPSLASGHHQTGDKASILEVYTSKVLFTLHIHMKTLVMLFFWVIMAS